MSNPYENLPDDVEPRVFAEFRATDDGGAVIEGHAATFNQPYRVRDFKEQVAPGAFDDVLGDDVFALLNHNPDKLLGRTSSGTLEMQVDETGLFTRTRLPKTTDGENVRKLIQRGDLSEMSFGFRVAEDSWERMDDGTELRTIERVGELYDVSPVTMAANPFTDVTLRGAIESRREWRDAAESEEPEVLVVGPMQFTSSELTDEQRAFVKHWKGREMVREVVESPESFPTRADLDELWGALGKEPPTIEEMADDMEALAGRLRQKAENRQSRPDFDGTEDVEPDWADGGWGRPDLSDHPEASAEDTWGELDEGAREAIAGRFIVGTAGADTYGDLAYPVVNPATDNLNRNGLLAARQRASAEDDSEVSDVADALWEEFYAEGEENIAVSDAEDRLRMAHMEVAATDAEVGSSG